jgi:hypothetical protein
MCNSFMIRAATEPRRLYRLSALASEPVHDRMMGYGRFELWGDSPRPGMGGT